MLVALLLAVPAGLASLGEEPPEPRVTYIDWTEGHFPVGLVLVGVGTVEDGGPVPQNELGGVNLARFTLPVNGCHRSLLVDLLYEPEEFRVEVDDGTWVSVPYEWRLDVFGPDGESLGSRSVFGPAFGIPLGVVEGADAFRLDLYMLKGVAADWSLRVRGAPSFDDPSCDKAVHINEVEANPAGPDAGNEWIELVNPAPWPANLSGWTVRTTHGRTASLSLPVGTVIEPGQRLVVNFTDGQAIDNQHETIELVDAIGTLLDATPVLADTANDHRSNQRSPEVTGPWQLLPATPGAPPP